MSIQEIIQRKREGEENTPAELATLVAGLRDGSVPEYQLSAWCMAVVFQGMTPGETARFTRLMMESGEVLDLSDLPGVKVDKHSTGGVGDKVTIPLAPAVAAAGGTVPMISGRGLGHTGGTLDKLESIPGLTTDLDPSEFRRVVREAGFAIIAASSELAPADSRLYALRDVTATVPSVPLITASILSKKYAAGVDALVLDVKAGSGAFMREPAAAQELARVLVSVSAELGKRATAVVTSMEQPLGRAVGNALEVRESLEVLRGAGPADVRELVEVLGGRMLVLAGLESDPAAAERTLAATLDSGSALEAFRTWVALQGGDPAALDDPAALPQAPVVREAPSPAAGHLAALDTRGIGYAANFLGAGRSRVGDAIDPAVGFEFLVRLGERVEAGQSLARVHARTEEAAAEAARRLAACAVLAESPPPLAPLVLEVDPP